ncbi:hypothetical protein TWF730_003507 [Orbilia blumenaviensis]|uniref:DASH complex subunit SPC19 n=1 Tax=Orbilia blumenaviensis TaxID=1796055 RepID=A0AAV9U534_9PEZI
MASSSSRPDEPPAPLSADLETLTSVYSEVAAYLAKLTAQLEELETTQTTLIHSYHATSRALADIRGYNAVAPTMELLPTYTAKAARLKQLMIQQRQTVDRMKVKAEEVRKVKAANYERLKRRWEEERERDKGLAARMVGVVGGKGSVGGSAAGSKEEEEEAVVAKATGGTESSGNGKVPEPSSSTTTMVSRIERQLEHQKVPHGSEAAGPSTPPIASTSTTTTTVVAKTVVKRKKKARQAEIE